MTKLKIDNKHVMEFVEQAQELCCPEQVVLIDGSAQQLKQLTEEALRTGELIRLNEQLLPNCYLHRSAINDVARVEHRTFICCENAEDCGPTNNYMPPQQAYDTLKPLFSGCMKGKTMYVVPFSMGVIGSPFSKIGIEITDSIYVVVSMNIMTRMGQAALDALGQSNDFVRGMHAKADLSEENRYICHFPQDNAIWSINSGYGGNVLLGKKCLALRIASAKGREEGWLAEHMLILGVQNPQGQTHYVAAAFPSACGKTNLAMLIPPEVYQEKGYKVWCVGDDIAWIRVKNGQLYAVNPENGFFGVAPGTNLKTNANALKCTQRDTIFTNVVHDLDKNTVWWEGLDEHAPTNAVDWTGQKWTQESKSKGAHPNSRFTAPAKNCPCISPQWENAEGVPLSAIVFGGRRASLAPLIYEARHFEHGVFVGATMASETTAAATGAVGQVRRDPMAMLPFCGYNMGDYFAHWLKVGQSLQKPPKIFHVNWFRKDAEGNFLWHGFGENMRVLEWIIARCENSVDAQQTPIGFVPQVQDLNLEGLDISQEQLHELLKIDKQEWLREADLISDFFDKFDRLPSALRKQLQGLKDNLN